DVLANAVSVSVQAVSKWERAESSPDTDNLIALAKLYGISVDELLNTSSDKVVISNTKKKDKDIKGKIKSLLSKANDFGLYPKVAENLFKFPYPIIVVIIYLALSMIFKIWHPLWIIFLTIPIYYRIAIACKANNNKVFNLLLPIPEFIVSVYLILGFATHAWGYLALLYLIIPIYYWFVAFFTKAK
ncbi:MAG: helix-turn-helix domain-containing protein, partial [Eubacterium sp.]